MSRNPVEEKNKFHPTMTSLDMRSKEIVELYGVGKTFSEKLRSIIKQFSDDSCMIVRYDNEEQRCKAEPTILKDGAVHVFSGIYGLMVLEDEGIKCKGKKDKRSDEEWLKDDVIPILEKEGWLTQLIVDYDSDFQVDLWMWKKSSLSNDDRYKKLLDEMKGILSKLESVL